MTTSRHQLPSGTPTIEAQPAVEPERAVVVLPDVGGLGPEFERIAAELAEQCRARVCVVELFPGREELTFEERIEFGLREISERRVLDDVEAAVERLAMEPVVAMGFCIGGALAMRSATLDRFDGIVSWYGMVHLSPAWAGDKGDPLDAVTGRSIPVLQIVGDADEFINSDDLDDLDAAGADVRRVPGARHGFAHNPRHPNHDPESAAAMWSVALEFVNAIGGDTHG